MTLTQADYIAALRDLERACSSVNQATQALTKFVGEEFDDSIEGPLTVELCRRELLAALAAAPPLACVFIVPART